MVKKKSAATPTKKSSGKNSAKISAKQSEISSQLAIEATPPKEVIDVPMVEASNSLP